MQLTESTSNVSVRSQAELLGVLTLRLIFALLGLWIVNLILNGLAFVKDLRIPDFDMPIPVLISSLVYLIMAILLVNYARVLSTLWAQAFPRYPEAASVLTSLVYLGVLAVAYKSLHPVFLFFATDPEPLMIFQLVLLVIAVVIIVRAGLIIYNALPAWIIRFRRSFEVPRGPELTVEEPTSES
jgi:hypothetical protein